MNEPEINPLENCTLRQMREMIERSDLIINTQKENKDTILNELKRRFESTQKALLKGEGKEGGATTFHEEECKLKFEIPKKVKWDSEMLAKIGNHIPPVIRMRLFKVEISIPEKMFDGLTDANLISELSLARTVEYGDAKVSFCKD